MSFFDAYEAKERTDNYADIPVETERQMVEEDIEEAVLAGKYEVLEENLCDENNEYFRGLKYRVLYVDTGVKISWDKPLD